MLMIEPEPPAHHRRDGVLATQEHASDVHSHHLVPRVDVGVDDRMVRLGHDPGVVVEHVEPAIGGDGVVDHRLGVGLAADVHLDQGRLATGLPDEVDGLRPGRLAELGDDDLRALGGEQLGGDPAHPAAAAGDDRHLVVQSHGRDLLDPWRSMGRGRRQSRASSARGSARGPTCGRRSRRPAARSGPR